MGPVGVAQMLPSSPQQLFGNTSQVPGLSFPTLSRLAEVAAPWTEETIKQCLYLYLALLPQNHKLIHELASVYTEAIADIKRTVLRVIEQPVCELGVLWVVPSFPNSSLPHPLLVHSSYPILIQIRGMGMNSPELLLLVENCPKGAETLVTRCLHSLTDKGT